MYPSSVAMRRRARGYAEYGYTTIFALPAYARISLGTSVVARHDTDVVYVRWGSSGIGAFEFA